MKRLQMCLVVVVGLLLVLGQPGFSQGWGNGDGWNDWGNGGGWHHGGGDSTGWYNNPDSLSLVTVSGTAIVDSSTMMMPMYYLDEDGDGQPDYHLNFGPYWYQPDSSNAVRPGDGDAITITGGSHDSTMYGFPTVVVYEINGEFWRDPYNPFWHNYGGHSHSGGHHQGGCNVFGFGWQHDSLQTISLSGKTLIDSTFMIEQYFLDEDGDGMPDYFLNFGPPWYVPDSLTHRPLNGEQITVKGYLMNGSLYKSVLVLTLNGEIWRDSTLIGRHFGGGWIHRNMNQAAKIHAPFDLQDWMQVNPGWYPMGGGHHGGMMLPDSMFGQILQLYPQNIPNAGNQNPFAGYEVGMFYPDGQNGMWQGDMCGGHMNFENNVQFQLHYNEIQMRGFNLDENSVQAKYWDDQSNSWVTVSNVQVDPVSNTVSFSSAEVSSLVILTADQVTGIETDKAAPTLSKVFELEQNYPNPFNPETNIRFSLKNNAQVVLNIYNVLGQKILALVNKNMVAGIHAVNFNAESLPSGTYFYELRVDGESKVMKMNLMK